MMTRPARMRDFRGWGILSVLMQRVTRRSGLLAAIMVAPLVAGCSALGLREDPTTLGLTGAAEVADPAATLAPLPSPVQLSSNDGYSLTLPAGWVGSRTNNEATREAFAALTAGDPLLGTEASRLYEDADADLSMVAANGSEVGLVTVPSVMAIVVIPSRRGSDDTEELVGDFLSNPAIAASEVERSVASVRAGDAERYDVTVAGDLVTVQLRVYLFTVGDDGFIVLFGSDPAIAASAASDMEAIVKSLRFGV
jgi:hypothetical protein